MTRAVEDALIMLGHCVRFMRSGHFVITATANNIEKSHTTLAAHIAAQDLTVQHLEGSCDVLRERIAAQDAEIARLRQFVNDCADGLPEWQPGECRKRAIALKEKAK